MNFVIRVFVERTFIFGYTSNIKNGSGEKTLVEMHNVSLNDVLKL